MHPPLIHALLNAKDLLGEDPVNDHSEHLIVFVGVKPVS